MTEPTKNARPKGRLTIYFCGGSGINIARAFNTMKNNFNPAQFADVKTVMVDSSDSNVEPGDVDNLYQIPDLDGGGKIRSLVYKAFAPRVAKFVEDYKPGDVSLIVSSLGGATGATVGYVLAKELLTRNAAVMAVGVTNTDSLKETRNSAASISSYENVVEETGRPLVLAPFNNEDSSKQLEVNNAIAYFLCLVAKFASRRNTSLDTQDIYHWINYDKVTDVPPALMGLVLSYKSDFEFKDKDHIVPISVATLAKQGDSINPGFEPDYQTVGYVPENDNDIAAMPCHMVIADGVIQEVFKVTMAEKLDRLERRAKDRKLAGSIGFRKTTGKKTGGFVD